MFVKVVLVLMCDSQVVEAHRVPKVVRDVRFLVFAGSCPWLCFWSTAPAIFGPLRQIHSLLLFCLLSLLFLPSWRRSVRSCWAGPQTTMVSPSSCASWRPPSNCQLKTCAPRWSVRSASLWGKTFSQREHNILKRCPNALMCLEHDIFVRIYRSFSLVC